MSVPPETTFAYTISYPSSGSTIFVICEVAPSITSEDTPSANPLIFVVFQVTVPLEGVVVVGVVGP